MAISHQQKLLGLGLLATLMLTWKASQEKHALSELSLPTRVASSTSIVNEQVNIAGLVLKQRPLQEMHADLFEAPHKTVNKGSVPEVSASRPQAPVLPFRYLGRWQAGNTQSVSLEFQDAVLTVQPGDMINNQYKLIKIIENASSIQLHFLYIPLNQMQVMYI